MISITGDTAYFYLPQSRCGIECGEIESIWYNYSTCESKNLPAIKKKYCNYYYLQIEIPENYLQCGEYGVIFNSEPCPNFYKINVRIVCKQCSQ